MCFLGGPQEETDDLRRLLGGLPAEKPELSHPYFTVTVNSSRLSASVGFSQGW